MWFNLFSIILSGYKKSPHPIIAFTQISLVLLPW